MRCRRSGEKGAILLIVLIVILTISLLGTSLIALFYNVLVSSRTELDRARALYLAEAGIAKAISMFKSQTGTGISQGTTQQQIVAPTHLGEGSFEVYNDFSQSTIVSIGISQGTKRTIQVKYNAF